MKLKHIPRKTVIYAAVAAALALVFVFQETTTSRENTIPVPEIPDTIDRIVLQDGTDRLELSLAEEENWVVGEDAFPASSATIDEMLKLVRGIEEADVISARGNYDDYGLQDDTARRIRLFAGDTEPLAIQLGDAAVAGDAVYARLNGSREVVLLPRDLNESFSVDAVDFRETAMAAVPEEEITRITIDGEPFESVVVERPLAGEGDDVAEDEEPAWTASSDGDLPEIAAGRFRNLFQELDPLRAQGFPDEDPAGAPFARVTINRTGGEPVVLEVWPPTEERNFPVTVTAAEYPFYVPEWRVRRLLLGLDRYLEPYATDDEPM